MKKILVSGASGIVGYGILKSLRGYHTPLQLIGTTIYEDSVAQGFCDVFEKAPLTNDTNYVEWLLSVIRKYDIDLIIPGIDADMYMWMDHRNEISQTGTRIMLNNPHLVSLCRDKWTFFNELDMYGTPHAIDSSVKNDFELLAEKFGLPFLMKPRHGFGSKGIVRVADKESFAQYADQMDSVLMAQPIVGTDDEEYTTSAFCDGEGGFTAYMTLRRKLSKDGFTDKAEVVDLNGVEDALNVLCRIFKPVGPTNFQFRLHEGVLKLLEINPRVSSSTSIRAAFGYNECQMALDYFLENKLPAQPVIRKGRAVRYIEDFVFYT